jgi:hypothetical protein
MITIDPTAAVIDHGTVIDEALRLAVADAIKSRRDTWTHYGEYAHNYPVDVVNNLPKYFLGSPVYMVHNNHNLYEGMRARSQQLLESELFVNLRQAALQRLSEHHGKPVEHLQGTSLPGFHVYNSLGKAKTSPWANWHIDSNLVYMPPYENYDASKIRSFVVFIEVSKLGDYLGYKVNGTKHQHYYTPGVLYSWSSVLEHRIGNVVLPTDDEYRISLQGHIYEEDAVLKYYW